MRRMPILVVLALALLSRAMHPTPAAAQGYVCDAGYRTQYFTTVSFQTGGSALTPAEPGYLAFVGFGSVWDPDFTVETPVSGFLRIDSPVLGLPYSFMPVNYSGPTLEGYYCYGAPMPPTATPTGPLPTATPLPPTATPTAIPAVILDMSTLITSTAGVGTQLGTFTTSPTTAPYFYILAAIVLGMGMLMLVKELTWRSGDE